MISYFVYCQLSATPLATGQDAYFTYRYLKNHFHSLIYSRSITTEKAVPLPPATYIEH
jgi:hypothetical protein